MATSITMFGNILTDVELRFTPSGIPVANFRFAQSDRIRNKETGDFQDQSPELSFKVEVWRHAAERVANSSLPAGTRLVLHGMLRREEDWTDRNGNERRGDVKFVAQEVAASTLFGEVTATKPTKKDKDTAAGMDQQPTGANGADPWATSAAPAGAGAADPWASAPGNDPWA